MSLDPQPQPQMAEHVQAAPMRCRFCGAVDVHYVANWRCVQCAVCMARGPEADDEQACIALWNRIPPGLLRRQVEALWEDCGLSAPTRMWEERAVFEFASSVWMTFWESLRAPWPKGTRKTLLHVNMAVIQSNQKHGQNEPALTVKTHNSYTYAHSVEIDGPSRIVYSKDKPLSCGASTWLETTAPVRIVREPS